MLHHVGREEFFPHRVERRNERHEERTITGSKNRSARHCDIGSVAARGQPPVANHVRRTNSHEWQQDERIELPGCCQHTI
jgi:hypothetical protein